MSHDSERRQYYRIDDELIFSYRVLERDEIDQPTIEESQHESRAFEMMQKCSVISQEMKSALGGLEASNPELGRILRGLDRKINLVTQMVVFQDTGEEHPQRRVNLGLGGIAFGSDEKLKPDTLVLIKMILGMELRSFRVRAKVVNCSSEKEGDYPYRIACEFVQMSEIDSQALSRHVIRHQQEELQRKRQQTLDGD